MRKLKRQAERIVQMLDIEHLYDAPDTAGHSVERFHVAVGSALATEEEQNKNNVIALLVSVWLVIFKHEMRPTHIQLGFQHGTVAVEDVLLKHIAAIAAQLRHDFQILDSGGTLAEDGLNELMSQLPTTVRSALAKELLRAHIKHSAELHTSARLLQMMVNRRNAFVDLDQESEPLAESLVGLLRSFWSLSATLGAVGENLEPGFYRVLGERFDEAQFAAALLFFWGFQTLQMKEIIENLARDQATQTLAAFAKSSPA